MQSRMQHELLVVSDIHLISDKDERGNLLLEMLSNIDTSEVRYLVLLGDIFDFCFGASQYFREKYSKFGDELSRISRSGVKVHFVEGNHEFILNGLKWDGVHFVNIHEDLRIQIPNGPTFLFNHGDSLEAPWHYRLYSNVIRSRVSAFCARKLPQTFLDNLALKISGGSRQKSYTQSIDHKKIVARIQEWVKGRADYGIVGHFHIPYDVKGDGSRIFGLDSWDKPNCLSYHKGQFFRTYLKAGGNYNTVPLDN